MKRCVCLLSVVVAAAWSVVGLSAEKPSSFSEMQSNFKDEERALRKKYLEGLCSLTNGSGKRLSKKEWIALTNEIAQIEGVLEPPQEAVAGVGGGQAVQKPREREMLLGAAKIKLSPTQYQTISQLAFTNFQWNKKGGRFEIRCRPQITNEVLQCLEADFRIVNGGEKNRVYDVYNWRVFLSDKSEDDFMNSGKGVLYFFDGKKGKNAKDPSGACVTLKLDGQPIYEEMWLEGNTSTLSSRKAKAQSWLLIGEMEGTKVNVNTATKETLKKELGLHADEIRNIIEARPFENIKNVDDVDQVGEDAFDKINKDGIVR